MLYHILCWVNKNTIQIDTFYDSSRYSRINIWKMLKHVIIIVILIIYIELFCIGIKTKKK